MTITLRPSNRKLTPQKPVSLLQLLQDNHTPIGSSCGGKGVCGTCRVHILSGKEHLPDPTPLELQCAVKNKLAREERISCQLQVDAKTVLEITTSYW